MKNLVRTLLLIFSFCIIRSSRAEDANKNPEFANIQKVYQEQVAKIEENYASKPKTVLTGYSKALDELEQAMTRKGDLKGVVSGLIAGRFRR